MKMKMNDTILNRYMSYYVIGQFSKEIIEFMLSFDNRLATIYELENKLYKLVKDRWLEVGILSDKPKEEQTNEQLLFGWVFATISFYHVARKIYEKIYYKATLQRLVDIGKINTSLTENIMLEFDEHEKPFFEDEYLKIFFEDFLKNG